MIFIELKPSEEKTTSCERDFALSSLGAIFLLVSLVSISQILYYYRYVASLQKQLKAIYVPQSVLYSFVIKVGIVESILVSFSIIAIMFCACWLLRKDK
jgi:hypothetical protein